MTTEPEEFFAIYSYVKSEGRSTRQHVATVQGWDAALQYTRDHAEQNFIFEIHKEPLNP